MSTSLHSSGRRLFPVAAVLVAAWSVLLPGLCVAEAPRLVLIGQIEGEYLTDSVVVTGDRSTPLRELHLGESRRLLDPAQDVRYAGGSVSVVSLEPTGVDWSVYDARGLRLRQVRLPAGARALGFGDAVAMHAKGLHEPGIPYAIEVFSPGGTSHQVGDGSRTVLEMTALEQHLVVTSVGPAAARPIRTDLLDVDGRVARSFESPNDVTPRVAVGESGLAAALYPGRRGSVLAWSREEGARAETMPLPAAAWTDVAVLNDGSGLLVWGGRRVIRVVPDEDRIVWETLIDGSGRQLANDTSFVTPVGGNVATLVREEVRPGSWRVRAVFLDAERGTVLGSQTLFDTDVMPTGIRRFRRGSEERIVLRDRVYRVDAP